MAWVPSLVNRAVEKNNIPPPLLSNFIPSVLEAEIGLSRSLPKGIKRHGQTVVQNRHGNRRRLATAVAAGQGVPEGHVLPSRYGRSVGRPRRCDDRALVLAV